MTFPLRPLLAALAALALAGCAANRPAEVVREGLAACGGGAGFVDAAVANAWSLDGLAWSPFGAPEQGWRTYAPRVGREIGTDCPPDSAAFAERLSHWREGHGLGPDGRMDETAFQAMKAGWQAQRPFLALRAQGVCPDPPPQDRLATAPPEAGYPGKSVALRRDALEALERMQAAARHDLPDLDPDALRLFSGFRSPAYDDARCARDGNCQGVVRAQCSAHRTGLAADLVVGAAPGYGVDSSDGPNRVFQSATPAYRWLLANAARFGFVNYPFEPWHWEWTGP